jgi:hypothetical protein
MALDVFLRTLDLTEKKPFCLKYSQFSWVLKALEGEASP